MAQAGRILASHVGTISGKNNAKVICKRCGRENQAGGRTTNPYMCGDCKLVDRPMAVRLGIFKQ